MRHGLISLVPRGIISVSFTSTEVVYIYTLINDVLVFIGSCCIGAFLGPWILRKGKSKAEKLYCFAFDFSPEKQSTERPPNHAWRLFVKFPEARF